MGVSVGAGKGVLCGGLSESIPVGTGLVSMYAHVGINANASSRSGWGIRTSVGDGGHITGPGAYKGVYRTGTAAGLSAALKYFL
jgi:hypothetical protein